MTRKTALLTGLAALFLLIGLVLYHFYPWGETPQNGVAAEHLAPLQGRWAHLIWKADGPPTPTGAYFTIRGNIITYTVKTGVPAYHYVIDALDPSQDPPWIDWTAIDRYATARKMAFRQRGVYRLDGDLLIIRLSRPGESRPREAGMEPGEGDTVFILKRAPDSAP